MDLSKYKVKFLIETVRKEDISDEVYFSDKYIKKKEFNHVYRII